MRIFQHSEMSASIWLAGARREPSHIWYLIPNNNWNRNFILTIDTHTHSLTRSNWIGEWGNSLLFFSFVRVELCTELVVIKMILNTKTCTTHASEWQQFYGHVLSFEAMRLAAYHNEWKWIRVEIRNLIESIEIMRSAGARGFLSHGIYCSSNSRFLEHARRQKKKKVTPNVDICCSSVNIINWVRFIETVCGHALHESFVHDNNFFLKPIYCDSARLRMLRIAETRSRGHITSSRKTLIYCSVTAQSFLFFIRSMCVVVCLLQHIQHRTASLMDGFILICVWRVESSCVNIFFLVSR